MNKKIMFGTIIGLIVLISVSLFFIRQNITGSAIYDLREIDLAINPVPNSALIFIAEENNYFQEQGLKVNYHSFPTGKLALDALLSGGADIATTADIPLTLAGLAKQDFKVIATIEYSTDNVQVVARRDAGINKPSDLKGKIIATTKGGGPLYFTHKFLERHNIEIEDIKLVHLKPSDMVTSIIKGDIDAFIVFEPSPNIAKEQLGDNAVVFSPDDLYGETWNIVITKDTKEVESFLKALLKAQNFIRQQPGRSIEIVSKYSGTKQDILRQVMKKQKYGVGLTDVLINSLYEEAQWAIDQGLTSQKEIPDYQNLIDDSYLKRLYPAGITI